MAIEGISSQEPRGAVGRGLAAGFGASAWTALVGLAVIPFYVRFLGLEGYGLIGFLATMQAVLALLDLGLAPTLNREVARGIAAGELAPARRLLHTLALFYAATALVIGLALAAAAPAIAAGWLRAGTLDSGRLAGVVALMALVIACRWPGPLYQGALMGAQRVGAASVLSAASFTVAALGGVLVLAWVSPTLQAFLLWHAAASLLAVLAMRALAWRALGREPRAFHRGELRRVWRFAAGVSGITVAGVLVVQADKLALSKLLPLADYGGYMLAVAIAGTLYLFSQPFFNVLYPRFALLAHAADETGLRETYRLSTRLLSSLVFPAAMVCGVFARDLVQAWTGDAALAAWVAPLLPLLAAGVALHCVMYVPYALQLAQGMTWIPILNSVVMLAVALPLTIGLAWAYGAPGGATAWLVVQILAMLLGSWVTHRYLLKGLWAGWLALDVGVPLAVSVAAGLLAWQALPQAAAAPWRLAAALAWGLAACGLSVALSPALRASLLQYARDFSRRAPQHD